MSLDDYERTDEDYPETFQYAKDERDRIEKWVKKNLGRKWTSQHHEKGLYSIYKMKPTKKLSKPPKMVDMTAQVMGGLKKVQAGKKGQFASTPLRRPKRKSSTVPIRLKSQNQKDWIAFGVKELKAGDYYDKKGSGKRQNKELFDAVRAAKTPDEIVEILDSIGIEVMTPFYDDSRPVMEGAAAAKKPVKSRGIGTWTQLLTNINDKYSKMKGYSATIVPIWEKIYVQVPVNQADRIGKNLSSQVSKFRKRHNSPWKTSMSRTAVNIGGKKHITFTIRQKW